MRDFSKVSPSLWRSRKFRALQADSDARLVYLYLLTNPHANSAGCYDLLKPYACADLEWENERYNKAMDTVSRAGLVLLDGAENTILITNWIKFNSPSNPKHTLGMLDQLEEASSVALKRIRYQEIKADVEPRRFLRDREVGATIMNRFQTFFEQFGEGIRTETETETETESKTKTEKETESKTETRETAHGVRAASPNGSAHPPSEEEEPDLPDNGLSHLLKTPLMRRTGR